MEQFDSLNLEMEASLYVFRKKNDLFTRWRQGFCQISSCYDVLRRYYQIQRIPYLDIVG